jgi:lipoprotein-anchoring transpeptidase ErfK/SrfK
MRHLGLTIFFATMLAMATSIANAKILINVDKSVQMMTVSVDGEPRWTWPVSTGRRGYATPSGRFTAFRMAKVHFSKEWDDAPMPHSIFFTQRGHAIHGSYDTRHLGTAASHGCVRLNPANAAKLFALVQEQGVTNATVVISGGAPAVARTPTRRHNVEDEDEAAPAPAYAPPGYRRPGMAPNYPAPGYDPQPNYAPQPYYTPQGYY